MKYKGYGTLNSKLPEVMGRTIPFKKLNYLHIAVMLYNNELVAVVGTFWENDVR